MLQSSGLKRARHNLATEQQQKFHFDGGMSRGHKSQLKEFPMDKTRIILTTKSIKQYWTTNQGIK